MPNHAHLRWYQCVREFAKSRRKGKVYTAVLYDKLSHRYQSPTVLYHQSNPPDQ